MSEVTWLVTGTSRGIGLEIVRQLLVSPGNVVFAACRSPDSATKLKALATTAQGKLHVFKMDVSSKESIRTAADSLKGIITESGINYIINNAGINLTNDTAFSLDVAAFERTIQANVIGPSLIATAFLPYLEKAQSKVILNISSGLSSITLDHGPKMVSYSVSKIALNMLTYKQSRERPDIIAFVLDPGWVKTDMGGEGAQLEPEESVASLLGIIKSVTSEHSGKLLSIKGNVMPW